MIEVKCFVEADFENHTRGSIIKLPLSRAVELEKQRLVLRMEHKSGRPASNAANIFRSLRNPKWEDDARKLAAEGENRLQDELRDKRTNELISEYERKRQEKQEKEASENRPKMTYKTARAALALQYMIEYLERRKIEPETDFPAFTAVRQIEYLDGPREGKSAGLWREFQTFYEKVVRLETIYKHIGRPGRGGRAPGEIGPILEGLQKNEAHFKNALMGPSKKAEAENIRESVKSWIESHLERVREVLDELSLD